MAAGPKFLEGHGWMPCMSTTFLRFTNGVIQKHTWKPSAATRANIVSACVNCSSFKVRSLYLHQPHPAQPT